MPAPTWASEIKTPPNFSWGNWLPCLPEYREFDCIDSVVWVKETGERITGTWQKNPTFDYASFSTEWVRHPDGYDLQYMKDGIHRMGGFKFEGLVAPCAAAPDQIMFDVRTARYSFQVNAVSACSQFFREKFEERFEVSLRSKYLKGLVGGVSSNGRAPSISFTESAGFGILTLSAKFAYIPWNGGDSEFEFLNVCVQNEEKARSGGWGLWNSIFFVDRPWGSDELLRENPGDMITGTNGWNCGGNLRWDPVERALVMEVGAPHYDVDGSLVEGWFEGSIRGRYIKSRFGINPAEAAGNARLEVVYTDGQAKIATISASYDEKSDVLAFNANGFTYSSPKLKLTFGEKKTQSTEQPSTVISSKSEAKTTKISCVKLGKVKKFASKKCPKGYKKE